MKIENVTNWIFITGLPRSGTTFLGEILSLSSKVDYLHEPFNPVIGIDKLISKNVYLPLGLQNENSQFYFDIINNLKNYNVKFKPGRNDYDNFIKKMIKKVIGGRGELYLKQAKSNFLREAVIIKDPTSYFMTEFLANYFSFKPVIILKHPLSFVASWKNLNWEPDLSLIYDQADLIKDYLSDDYELMKRKNLDAIQKISILWRVAHKVIFNWAKKYKKWIIVKHEDISNNPINEFYKLYETLELTWSKNIENKINKYTNSKNPINININKTTGSIRNSKAIFNERIQSLSLIEREKVFNIVKDVCLEYYNRNSFKLTE